MQITMLIGIDLNIKVVSQQAINKETKQKIK